MGTTPTLVLLAAELTLFIVAVAGVALSARDGLLGLDRAAKALLATGFAVLAAVAFAVGSLTVDPVEDPVALAAVRGAGAVLVALGALRWAGSRVGRPVLLGGLVLLVAAAVAGGRSVDIGGEGMGSEPLIGLAGLVIGAALVVTGRHTIPGRIATSVAGVLLAVVLLVSVALSAVITRTVEDEATERYSDRAATEATAAVVEAEAALDEATLIAASMSAERGADVARAGGPTPDPEARARVETAVAALAGPDGLAVDAPVVVVAGGTPVAHVPDALAPSTALAVAGDPVVVEAVEAEAPRQGVTVAGAAYAVAAVPVRTLADDVITVAGVVVVARPLDDAFLARRVATDSAPLGLSLVTRDAVVASSGRAAPPDDEIVDVARRLIDEGTIGDEGTTGGEVTTDGVTVARPVAAEGAPARLALVLHTPAPEVERTREDLYRSLFLIALLAGLAGIASSVLVGERIGGGIRRLTAAAARMREGDLGARAQVDREDELGELSTTFDAMASSVSGLTDDLRAAADEEARLRARLESVFRGVTEAVVAADEDRTVTDVNRAARRLLGLTADEPVAGRALDDVVVLRGPDGDVVVASAPSDRSRPLVAWVRPLDGTDPVPVVGTVAALRDDDGHPAGSVVVLRDVRREQALEAAKQDFLASIGHELRTPLTPIKGYAGVLRKRVPDAAQARAWADGITAGVDRLERLVDRLVTYSALTAGTSAGVGHDDVDVDALLDAVAAEWTAGAGDRTVEVERSGHAVVRVRGDEAQLRLALDELVDNAARFSAAGPPIRLRVARVDDDRAGDAVALEVIDGGGGDGGDGGDGDGFDALVAAFAQGEPTTVRTHDGLGLGLALTDRVARAHGGRLAIVTSPAGTIASIVVPVVTSTERS